MKLKHLSSLVLLACLLPGCSTAPVPESTPLVTIVPAETEAPVIISDVEDPVRISGEIRDYFASLGDQEHGSDIPVTLADDSGLPYVRKLRYTVSEMDLMQYLEETLVAHFEYEFEDVVGHRGKTRAISGFGSQEAVIREYTMSYAGETVLVSFASVRDGSDILSFCILTDEAHPLDAEALVKENIPERNA